ncbi:MAG TPA: hypothetical protein VLS89_01470, partial [Candidatus Nanopelagicales bacterium]|nr:hypothetical protein [Candidatus Nanopelagicales bacterium]
GEAEPLGALAALVEAAYLVALGDGSVDRRELLDTNARLQRIVGGGVLAAIHASLVDGRFEQAEHKALLALGSALGLPAAEMDQLIHDEMDAWS